VISGNCVNEKYNLIHTREWAPQAEYQSVDDLKVLPLFGNPLAIVVGAEIWNYQYLAEAGHARGISMPKASMMTLSMAVITRFLADG